MKRASICMATYDRPKMLRRTLDSIFRQSPPFEYEVIVVDDGSPGPETTQLCEQYPVIYHRIDREAGIMNPSVPRNMAYKLATADVIIAQSDDVMHVTDDAIERLVLDLVPGHFLIANVFAINRREERCGEFTGPGRIEPYFFLGSLFREDLYAVGGNDEDFRAGQAAEDKWFGQCLVYGRKLSPIYTTNIVGHHQWHPFRNNHDLERSNRKRLAQKHQAATRGEIPWIASGGAWPFVRANNTEQLFTDIYANNHWGNHESRSGTGSTLVSTEAIRKALPTIAVMCDAQTFLDMACGDCNWITHVNLGVERYIGGDIVEALIASNIERYGAPDRAFAHLDLLNSDLPKADLVLCRDCLVHLSFADVARAIANLHKSGSKYLLATTFTRRKDNQSIETGKWTPYNMQVAPFNFPEPIMIVNEQCKELYPQFTDKSLGLWRIADLVR